MPKLKPEVYKASTIKSIRIEPVTDRPNGKTLFYNIHIERSDIVYNVQEKDVMSIIKDEQVGSKIAVLPYETDIQRVVEQGFENLLNKSLSNAIANTESPF